MAGIFQSNPWSYGPSAGPFGPAMPINFGGTSPIASSPIVQLQYLQQLLQILPAQIQQLQQTLQVLPHHVAQLVVQGLIQSQALAGAQPGQPFQSVGAGVPFPSIPTGGTPFPTGQPGYVM